MKRREFINWVGLGLMASYFPVALAACSSDKTTAKTENLLAMGTEDQLKQLGFLLNEEAKVMVVQDQSGQAIALDPTCTHQGCLVEWQADSGTLVCPCHDAKFAPDGKVLAKPAPEPLASYEITIDQGQILVKPG